MKYIVSSLSPGMLPSKDFDTEWRHLEEDEFQFIANDAYSCIRAKEIANVTGFEYNPELVKCRIGDVLLLIEMYKGVLKFHYIKILDAITPLIRETEILCEEVN